MLLINNASSEKLRGGFYTPKALAAFILRWAFQNNSDVKLDILEPSCGDGIFLSEIQNSSYIYNSLTAIEIDTTEASKAKGIKLKNSQIINDDFHHFSLNTKQKFDLIIGNPPYIRYQYFDKQQQEYASEIFKNAGLKYTKLTNSWVSFVVASSLLLKEEGKIGFVLPAELLQVTHAEILRKFLSSFYNKIILISFKKLVFPDIQQEVVLLLCEKNRSQLYMIEHLEVNDANDLITINISDLQSPRKRIRNKANKWTYFFLEQKEIDFLEELKSNSRVKKLGHFAKVEVGITTGANSFFTVPLSTVKEFKLEKFAQPLVGRSVQIPSLIFTQYDWQTNRENNANTHLLTFPSLSELLNEPGALAYIKSGEIAGINEGYKCRIRNEWQMIPSLRKSEALFLRRNNLYAKLVINEANAFTTDTMHRVTIKPGINIKALTSSYYNSLSLAFSEICGRSYGGGVLELMPNETEQILIPYNQKNEELASKIDQMMRAKTPIFDILKITNNLILKENFDFTQNEIALVHNIWIKLSSRRLNRRN